MKKKVLISFCTAVACVLSGVAMVVVPADAEATVFDGKTELATDATLWQQSWFTDHYSFATIGSSGIVIDSYGTDSAVAGISLKQNLPYAGTINMTFNSENTTENGFMKVVFADSSNTANGNAMKFWEIADGAEHLSLEVSKNSVQLWQYNAGADGTANNQQAVQKATTNYIDGNDHTLSITYEAKETEYVLKLMIDDNVHFESSIASTKLYCGSILTVGGYANATVTDNLSIKSVKITDAGIPVTPTVEEDNLLGKADSWTITENEKIAYDATTATLNVNAYEGTAATLNCDMPYEAKVSAKMQVVADATLEHKSAGNITLMKKGDKSVEASFDNDGNVWLKYIDKNASNQLVGVAGEWMPDLLSAKTNVTITVTPELTDGDEDIFVRLTAGTKSVGLVVEDLDLIGANCVAIGGDIGGALEFTSLKVEDLCPEKSADAEDDLTKDTANWSAVVTAFDGEKFALEGSDFATYTKGLPVGSTTCFTLKGTSGANAWYYICFASYSTQGWDGEDFTGKVRFRITCTGSQAYYTWDCNGTTKTTTTPAVTNIMDGTEQNFKFVTEKAEDGSVKVVLYRNDVKEYEEVFASDSVLAQTEKLYFGIKATGAHAENPVISNVKSLYKQDVTAYNQAVAVKNAIYALTNDITEENAKTVKETAETLKQTATADTTEVINNVAYADYVIAKAQAVLDVVADKEAAKTVIDMVDALDYATITAENVDAAKEAVNNIKAAYELLTDAQKEYVTNYGEVETLEIAINAYEEYQQKEDPQGSDSESGDSETGSTSNTEKEESTDKKSGCKSSITAVCGVVGMLAGVSLIVTKKKED